MHSLFPYFLLHNHVEVFITINKIYQNVGHFWFCMETIQEMQ